MDDLSAKYPVSGSRYCDLCEEKPEILFKTIFHTPIKPKPTINSYFMDYLRNNSATTSLDYFHADQSDEAFQKALAKYCRRRDVPLVPQDIQDLADDWVYESISKFTANSQPVPLAQVLKKCDLSGSSGPLNRFFAQNKEQYHLHPDGIEMQMRYEEALSTDGSRSYWGGNLKQELRPVEKVKAKKTRIFMSAPAEHFFALSSLSLQFNDAIIEAAKFLKTPICIGMRTFGGSYDQIGKELERFETKFCGDVGGFDTSVTVQEQASVVNTRLRCMAPHCVTPASFNRLVNLYRDIVNTPVVLPDGVVAIIKGQPSGHANTGIDNSLHLLRRFFIVWLVNGGDRSYEVFLKHVYIRDAGDDSVIGTTEYGAKFLNPKTIRETFDKYYKAEVEYSDQLEFLGHYFLHNGKEYYPGFSHSRIVAALAYKGGVTASSNLELACSLRIEGYSCPESLRLLDSYCNYLVNKYPDLKKQYAQQFHSRQSLAKVFGVDLILQSRTISTHTGKAGTSPFVLLRTNRGTGLIVRKSIRVSTLQQQIHNKNHPNCTSCSPMSNVTISLPRGNAKPAGRQRKRVQPSKPAQTTLFARSGGNPPRRRRRNNRNRMPRNRNGPYREVMGDNTPVYSKNYSSSGSDSGNGTQTVPSIQCDYGSMLVDPANNMCRQPDGSGKVTALVRSTIYCSLTVDPTLNNGYFSARFRPSLGDPSTPDTAKILMVNPDLDWSTADWASKNSYVTTSTTGGSTIDLRVDPIAEYLTAQPPGMLTLIKGDAGGSLYPLSSTVSVPNNAFGIQAYGIPYKYSLVGLNQSVIHLPPGMYMFHVDVAVTTSTGAPNVSLLINADSDYAVIASGPATTSGSDSYFTADWAVELAGNDPYVGLGPVVGTPSFIAGFVTITPTYNPDLIGFSGDIMSPNMDNGIMVEMRPVAFSVFGTNQVSPINCGGTINSARVSGDLDFKNYSRNNGSTSTGQLQYFDALGRVPKSTSNELLKGCYVWWQPEDNDDREFKTPSVANRHDYPSIIVSGFWSPPNPVAGKVTILRFIVTTIYEFTTMTSIFELKTSCCLEVHREEVEMMLRNYRWAVENAEHQNFIARVVAALKEAAVKTGKFYMTNASTINSLAGSFAKALLL